MSRYAEGGLARQSPADAVNPPVPPNVAAFLEHGLADVGSWRIPVLLQLRADVSAEDISAVLTAVTGTHDALRLHIVERSGTWEQRVDEPKEFTDAGYPVASRRCRRGKPAGARGGVWVSSPSRFVNTTCSSAPLRATHHPGLPGGRSYLALSVHGIAGDNLSRDILLTDIFTGFNQRMAGEQIVLEPVTTSWREWSQRCAGLATHPAVLDSRDYWLQSAMRATLSVAGTQATSSPGTGDLARLSTALTTSETGEIDDARRKLSLPVEEMLLAALGRAIAVTVGDGARGGRSRWPGAVGAQARCRPAPHGRAGSPPSIRLR